MIARDELLQHFLVEGRELLERAATDLAALHRRGEDGEALDGLFRTLHTLKGSAALFDLPALTGLLHAAETRLEAARRDRRVDPELLSAVVRAIDVTDAWLEALDAGDPTDGLAGDTSRAFAGLTGGSLASPASEDAQPTDWSHELVRGLAVSGPIVAVRYAPSADAFFRGDDPLAVVRGVPGLIKLEMAADAEGEPYDPFRCALRLQAVSDAPIADVRLALRLVSDQVDLAVVETVDAAPRSTPDLARRSLRVDAGRLDELAALTDELVIAKNALTHETARLAAEVGLGRELANAQAAMERLVSAVHASVTGLRLVSLSHVFSRLPRQVREIAEALGKDVELLISGEQVAVDKSVAERLFEPLLHLVRNALDHGIEPAAERAAAGKRTRALLTITARAHGDEVAIDVSDDGRGIDPAYIRQAAIARGAITAEAAEALSDADAANLIFAAGLSTARAVSNVSGRGVGMDAVRAAVAQLGGRVAIENRAGRGLSVRLSLPAHVVLTKILVVKAGGERFGVPLESITESHRVTQAQVTPIRAGRAYVRKDTVVPLIRLTDLLGLRPADDAHLFTVLNVEGGGEPLGIQIDEIAERLEAPLRPLGGLLATFPGIVGTVLQGDGQVLLVLDLAELAA